MTSRFTIADTPLSGLKLLYRTRFGDERGYLERLFCAEELQPLVSGEPILQINRTLTLKRGTVRGLHYQQPPYAETKFVSCLRGEVFDVAVDLRRNSPTFLHWYGQVLSADNQLTMMIPKGFAHGLQTLSGECELLYFHTAFFHPEAEAGLNAIDPRLGIGWPEQITERSARDTAFASLTSDFKGAKL